jgi:hypothetical protein
MMMCSYLRAGMMGCLLIVGHFDSAGAFQPIRQAPTILDFVQPNEDGLIMSRGTEIELC